MENDITTKKDIQIRHQRHRGPIKREISNRIKHWIGKLLIDGAEAKVKIYDSEEEIKEAIKGKLGWTDRKMSGMENDTSQPTIYEALILAQDFFKCRVEDIVFINK